jgi:hypothetical protein
MDRELLRRGIEAHNLVSSLIPIPLIGHQPRTPASLGHQPDVGDNPMSLGHQPDVGDNPM